MPRPIPERYSSPSPSGGDSPSPTPTSRSRSWSISALDGSLAKHPGAWRSSALSSRGTNSRIRRHLPAPSASSIDSATIPPRSVSTGTSGRGRLRRSRSISGRASSSLERSRSTRRIRRLPPEPQHEPEGERLEARTPEAAAGLAPKRPLRSAPASDRADFLAGGSVDCARSPNAARRRRWRPWCRRAARRVARRSRSPSSFKTASGPP